MEKGGEIAFYRAALEEIETAKSVRSARFAAAMKLVNGRIAKGQYLEAIPGESRRSQSHNELILTKSFSPPKEGVPPTIDLIFRRGESVELDGHFERFSARLTEGRQRLMKLLIN